MDNDLTQLFEAIGSGTPRPISSALLWDQDMEGFDWQRSKELVVQRVVERGWPDDFLAAFRLYGGPMGFREIIKEVPYLSPVDMNFVCACFNLKKEELKCYTRKLSRERRFNS